MPKPGLHPMVKGKLESTQPKMANRSADPSFVSDHEFVELVWENGQVLMQGQSSRTRKNPSCTGFSSHTSNTQEKDGGNTITPKIGRFGDTVLNDFSSFLPLSHMGLGQDDEMVRWLNCPFEDSMQHDYSSEFFSELSGDDLNALSVKNNAIPTDKSSNYGQLARDSHKVSVHGDANQEQGNVSKVIGEGPESARPRNSLLCSSSLQQCEASVRSLRPRISNFISSTTSNALPAPCENSSQSPISARQLPNMKMEKQDPGLTRSPLQPSSNMDLMNFSHFSRPAALVKANLQSISAAASLGLSGVDRLGNNDKVSALGSSNAAESTLIESSGSKSTVFQSHSVSMPTEVNLKPAVGKPSNETLSAEQSEAIFQEEAFRNNRSPDQVLGRTSSFAASSALVRPDSGSAIEPVVASSSVCSGSSAGGPSTDPKHTSKRKFRDAEESECQSEDVEEESVGGRKPALARGGTGAKKSRAAEVHNLSERKRRDRINEKMRALQELIPNCNKVDKASMLDEAIEYLKSLQLQVQIMSMGNGFYMPPMMLPTGMPHIHASHMAHFSPMSIGMGMGMGMGVGFGTGGMLDMSGGSSGCPMMQVPHMHRAQFRCPPISGPTSLPGMVGSSLQMFGLPGQGLPLAMPHAPFLPPGGLSAKSVSAPNVYGVATPVEAPDSVLPSTTKDPIQNSNSEIMNKTSTECSQNLSSTQATKEGCEQSDLVQRNDQPSHVKRDKASNSIN